jgi:hypothetical protein
MKKFVWVEPNILKVFPPEEPEDGKGLMSTEERMDTDSSGAKTIIKSSSGCKRCKNEN